jgi:hypothetical protein
VNLVLISISILISIRISLECQLVAHIEATHISKPGSEKYSYLLSFFPAPCSEPDRSGEGAAWGPRSPPQEES